jgi:exodeoxyribonuclease V alpha subunit
MARMPLFRKVGPSTTSLTQVTAPVGGPRPSAPPPEAPPPAPEKPEFKIRGHVARILFQNEEDGFYIMSVQRNGTRFVEDQVKVKGYGINITPGQEIHAVGTYEAGKGQYKDELTLKATSITEVIPTSLEGIRRLLHGGFVKGIGPKYADLMLFNFGERLLDVAQSHPQAILSIPGLGEARARAFISAVNEKKAVPVIMSFLAEVGLGPGLSHRVYKVLGNDAVKAIKTNPYSLTAIPMIGFAYADKVALKMGVPPDSVTRIEAGIHAVLTAEAENGSTVMLRDKLLSELSKTLSHSGTAGMSRNGIPMDRLESVLDAALVKRTPVQSRTFQNGMVGLSLPHFVEQEKSIAHALVRLTHARTRALQDVDLSSPHFAHLDDDQKEAARTALTSNVSVITGRPGCGKTTVTKSIIQALVSSGRTYMACGPTGRAAKRFMEATGFMAKTMHSALESNGAGFGRHDGNPFEADFIVADEQSMADTFISYSILKAVATGTQFLYIGDVDQLRSIAAGQVLLDLIESDKLPVSVLRTIHRQAAGSDIVTNAHRIIDGKVPFSSGKKSDFSMIDCTDPVAQVQVIIEEYNSLINRGFKPEDIQILTPVRKTTDLGANSLNKQLKSILNPGTPGNSIRRGRFENEIVFSVGDRVMQTSNNKDLNIFNGDIGYIKSIDKLNDEIVVDFSGEEVMMTSDDLDDVELAYATTIHKSQGSEFPAVIIPVSGQHWMMWDRNLLYTAITRGKKEVILAGQMDMMERIVAKQMSSSRITGLREEITLAFEAHEAKHNIRGPASRPRANAF